MLSEPQTVEGTGTLRFRPPEGQAGQFAGVTITNLSGYPVLVSSSAQQVMVPAGITAPVPYDGSGQAVTVAAVPDSLGSPGPITARWYYVGSVMPAVAVPATTLDTGPADVNVTNATLTVETSGTIDTNVTNATLDISGPVTIAAATQTGSTFGTVNASAQNTVTAQITGDGSIVLVAAPSSTQQLQLFGSLLSSYYDVELETTSGTAVGPPVQGNGDATGVPQVTVVYNFDGALLPAGEGLNLVATNNASNLISIGTINYTVVG